MLKIHYPDLFEPGSVERASAEDLAGRVWELVSFLHDVAGVSRVSARLSATVTYHDACAGLRELGIREQPRALLASVDGLRLKELEQPDVCCGFGGTFCVKYPEIADRITAKKTADIASTGAEYLLSGDLGCLLNVAGKLHRDGSPIKTCHVAEVLAGMTGNEPGADD